MDNPGPYIPTTRDRIGARVEWLARLALWEVSQAVQAFERRPLYYQDDKEIRFYGPFEYRSPRQRDYERLRNSDARAQVEGMLNNPNPCGEGMQNALNNPNPTRINPAAFPWARKAYDVHADRWLYEGDGTLAALGLGNTFQR